MCASHLHRHPDVSFFAFLLAIKSRATIVLNFDNGIQATSDRCKQKDASESICPSDDLHDSDECTVSFDVSIEKLKKKKNDG